jgi:hypothetical protein
MSDTDTPAPYAVAPQLIARVPLALRGSGRIPAFLCLVLGIALGIAGGYACYTEAKPGTPLFKAFDPNQIQSAIPYTIFALFCWALLTCFFRWRRLRGLAQVSRPVILRQAVALLETGAVATLRHALAQPAVACSPLMRRVALIMEQWGLSSGLEQAEVVLVL